MKSGELERNMKHVGLYAVTVALAGILAAGCGETAPTGGATGSTSGSAGGGTSAAKVSGAINIDGSSTVTPIFAAVAEEFDKGHPDTEAAVGTSGTGGGFKKFIAGEIDIAMASRPIKEEEVKALQAKGIEFIELPVALDGLTLVVNPGNTWAESLTVDELKRIWAPNSKVKNWKDVRAGFPDLPLKLYGAGTDSGTFDYFTLAINGQEGASRTDYQASEDDNILVQGVKGDKGALGYFGYGYFEENKDALKPVKIDAGKGPVEPSPQTVVDGSYQPLSRPLFIYVAKKAADEKPQVDAFVDFFFAEGGDLVRQVGFIPMPADIIESVKKHWDERKVGTVFAGSEVGLGIKEILSKESGGANGAKAGSGH
ncbi:MAG: PstS family phosphate ABC transporter substrate-binding protein [Fimbriimonadaceae bacterium]|nr:PstS family phosphate ABC transporter substrate-binding protein [Fimbriimonadaceae bacterium]QYK55778.1 MAG: PstS family phosphate ABC transporter substrate-binding protein [Fimbriimonadaceae bacterium]